MTVLELKSVSKSFGGIKAVNDCSLGLEEGVISCLIGPNGAGKTTIFNIISGFLRADVGSISFRGKDITKLAPHQIVRRGVARSWQNLRLFSEIKVIDNVLLAIQNQSGESFWKAMFGLGQPGREFKRNKEKAFHYLEEVGLTEKADSLGTALSYGQQKRLSMARLLATEGDLLLLDEPFSGADAESVDHMFTLLRRIVKQGKTICFVEHNLEIVRTLAEQIYFMDEGHVLAHGTVDEILSRSDLSEIYFGKVQLGGQDVT